MPNMKDCNCCMEDIYQVMLKIAVLNQYIYDIIIFSGCMWVEGRFQCAPPPHNKTLILYLLGTIHHCEYFALP